MFEIKKVLKSFKFDKYEIKNNLNRIYDYSKNLKITNFDDLEVLNYTIENLEKLLYSPNSKIKTFIDDPNNVDRFYDVKLIIHSLKKSRSMFLEAFFKNKEFQIKNNNEDFYPTNLREEKPEEKIINTENKVEKKEEIVESPITEKIEETEETQKDEVKKINEIKESSDDLIFSNYRLNVFMKNNSFLEVEFIKENLKEDLEVLCLISQILFDSLNADGTNIIENFLERKVLIIPRFNDDNLINIERHRFNFDEKILKELREEISCILDFHHKDENEEINVEDINLENKNVEVKKEDNYENEIDNLIEKKENQNSLKNNFNLDSLSKKNDELDDLIMSIGGRENKKDILDNNSFEKEEVDLDLNFNETKKTKFDINHPNKSINLEEFKDNSVADDFEIEKEKDIDIKNDENVELLKNIKYETDNKVQEQKDFPLKSVSQENEEITKKQEEINPIKQEIKSQEVEENKTPIENKFLVYEDDKIYCVINNNSKVLGELNLFLKSNENFDKADSNDLTYLFIFSKVFSSILFDVLKPQGTNIIFNYKDNSLRIIPRSSDDGLKINWESSLEEVSVLENIKTKILEGFEKAKNEPILEEEPKIEEREENNIIQKKQEEKVPVLQNERKEKSSEEISSINNLEEKEEDTTKDRAEHLVKNLYKLP